MANNITHGLGRGIYFPINGSTHGAGVRVVGLRAREESPDQTNLAVYADMDGVYMSQVGATVRNVTVTTYDLSAFINNLGFANVGTSTTANAIVDDANSFGTFGLAFANWYRETGKPDKLKVTIYYAIQGTSPTVSDSVDEAEVTPIEYSFTGIANGFDGALFNGVARSVLTFMVDPNNSSDPNYANFQKLYGTTPAMVYPADFTTTGTSSTTTSGS